MRIFTIPGCLLALGACVSIEEAVLTKFAVAPGQRTLVMAFASPGPIMSHPDSKIETAAKIMPGVGILMKSSQDERQLKSSQDLQQYLPPFPAADLFYPILMKELAMTGHPGKFLLPAEAGMPPDALRILNRADNVLDWQLRYWVQSPDHPTPRNYSSNLALDDALVFEVNVAHGLNIGDQGAATPTLQSVIKLFRARTMQLLWRHENSVVDATGARTVYDFKVEPQDFLSKCQKLMPALAQKIAADYRTNLQAAGLFQMPGSSANPYGVGSSTTTAH